MQQKIEATGPYTPEHKGPYMLESPTGAVPCGIHCIVGDTAFLTVLGAAHPTAHPISKIWNAREVPVVREFWVVDYGSGKTQIHNSLAGAVMEKTERARIIHVREVLPVTDEIAQGEAPAATPGLTVVAWEGVDFQSGHELGVSRDRDRNFLDEQPSSGEALWHALVRKSDAEAVMAALLKETARLRAALDELRTAEMYARADAEACASRKSASEGRPIHVHEVLPGEGE